MKRTVAIGGAVVVLAAALFWFDVSQRRPGPARAQVPHREVSASSPPAAAAAVVRRDRVEPAATATADPTSSPSAAQEKTANGAWADPAWQEARVNEALLEVEARYGRLFDQLGWPADRIEALKRRMAFDQVALMQQALLISSEGTTAAASLERGRKLDRIIAAQQDALRQLMGEADYARLDRFQQAETYRESVDRITNAMRANGSTVSGDLEESILDAYAQSVRALALQGSTTPVAATDAQRAEAHREVQQKLQMELIHRLSGVLDERQLDAFLRSQMEQDGG